MVGYMLLLGTSNTRQYSPSGQRKGRLYHHNNHKCCLVPEKGTTKVADYPGLSTSSWLWQKCRSKEFVGLKPWEVISNCCLDTSFSGIVATIFLCNDLELMTSHQGDIAAVKKYFEKLSILFAKVLEVKKIKKVILTTSLFRQSDFLDPVNLEFKQKFNNSFLNSMNTEGCQIKVGDWVVQHTILDLNSVFNTSQMFENKFYCKQELPPPSWKENGAVHLNRFYSQKILDKFHEIKKKLDKYSRRKHRGGRKP